MSARPRRPRLTGFTVLCEGPDLVRLVGGEDLRFTLRGPGLGEWLPAFLRQLDGRRDEAALLAGLPATRAAAGGELLERLWGERVLVEGSALAAHTPRAARLRLEGEGPLRGRLAADPAQPAPGAGVGAGTLRVLCQDRLDLAAALDWNAACLAGRDPWVWASTGPASRGWVSPVFLPAAGPCLACLLERFERISPAPEVWRALVAHARAGGAVEPVSFPDPGLDVLAGLVRWKAALLAEAEPPAALFRLQVLEVATLEVSAHVVPRDPDCPACGEGATA